MTPEEELTHLKKMEASAEAELAPLCNLPCLGQTHSQWGLILMVVGLIWLLSNLGLLATAASIWLWPLLLICCGLFTLTVFRR